LKWDSEVPERLQSLAVASQRLSDQISARGSEPLTVAFRIRTLADSQAVCANGGRNRILQRLGCWTDASDVLDHGAQQLRHDPHLSNANATALWLCVSIAPNAVHRSCRWAWTCGGFDPGRRFRRAPLKLALLIVFGQTICCRWPVRCLRRTPPTSARWTSRPVAAAEGLSEPSLRIWRKSGQF